MQYQIEPFPAVRSNRNSWSPKTVQYHAKMNALRALVGKDRQTLINMLLAGNCYIVFTFSPPKSWSRKKTQEMIGKPHTSKPDIDNVWKATVDSLFYQMPQNDSAVYNIHASKIWGDTSSITFYENR